MKKAQAAMEFLMTYGWALLIVVLAIGALVYWLKPTSLTPENCQFNTASGLFCEKFDAAPGNVRIKLSNHLSERIQITGAAISQDGDTCTLAGGPTGWINEDDSLEIVLSGGGSCANLAAPGKKLKGDISVTYEDPDAFPRTVTGSVVVQIPD